MTGKLPAGMTKLDMVAGDQQMSVADIAAAGSEKQPSIILERAVVVEVLYDLAAYSDKEIEELKMMIGDNSKEEDPNAETKNSDFDFKQLLLTSPRNTILARPISGGADKREARVVMKNGTSEVKCRLCYPFFPPHIAMPVKPGEVVWLMNDTPDGSSSYSYWVCRVSAPDYCDDVNYTHMDRMHSPYLLPKKGSDPSKLLNDVYKNQIFGFPNGDFPDALTLVEADDFEYIVQESTAYQYAFTPAAVPRFTKRPADLVFQGSNNTLICLGEDRGWTKKDSSAHRGDSSGAKKSNATKDDFEAATQIEQPSGTIDIVAGRGRYQPPFFGKVGGKAESHRKEFKGNNAAETIENTPPEKGRSSYVETNKNRAGERYIADEAQSENRESNPTEGDPDFYTDAARIYVSMATSVDKNFSLDKPGKNIPTAFEVIEPSEDISVAAGQLLPSAVIAKSDQIRLVARKMKENDPGKGAHEIKGGIRLIKEGDPKDDLSAFMMLEDGTIQMSGKKVFIGRTGDDGMLHSDYGSKGPGPGDSQPYIRFSDLQKLLTDLWDLMNDYSKVMLTAVSPGGGQQSPQILKAHNELIEGLNRIKTNSTRSQPFDKLGSDRIFGE